MELLTIAEFAEKVGVTKQAIYKRLGADLAPFLVVENGVKLLKIEALEATKTTQQLKENQEIKALQARIAELESLNAQLNADKLSLTEKLASNSEKLLEILSKQTQLQENSQVLIAQVNSSLMQLLPPVDKPIETESTELKEVDLNLNETKSKPSFISRLFKRS